MEGLKNIFYLPTYRLTDKVIHRGFPLLKTLNTSSWIYNIFFFNHIWSNFSNIESLKHATKWDLEGAKRQSHSEGPPIKFRQKKDCLEMFRIFIFVQRCPLWKISCYATVARFNKCHEDSNNNFVIRIFS